MTVETLIAFGAAAICLVLLPGPLTTLVARFAVQKGRKSAIWTVPRLALGMTAAMTLAALPLTAVALLLPGSLGALAWLGIAYLMLYALWSFQDPILRRAVAENDNLPERTPLRIFVHFVSACLQTPRYIVVTAALLVQFLDPSAALRPVLLEMQAVFLATTAAAASFHAAFPNWTLKTLRRARPTAPASHKFGTRFIARRAVTAGYRRIAA
jgi:threonine/homoserine/homoserine lactone efflux protein